MSKLKNNIVFRLNESEKMVIEPRDSLQEITCCYDMQIFFYEGDKKICIADDDMLVSLGYLVQNLSKVIGNNLPLHESIADNIGLLYAEYYFDYLADNQDLHKESNILFEKNSNDWVGEKYAVWIGEHALWIYNENNNIILEITPYFKIDDCTLEEDTPNVIAYEAFIQNYKSLVKRIISKEIAQEWLEQANDIIQMIERNIQ